MKISMQMNKNSNSDECISSTSTNACTFPIMNNVLMHMKSIPHCCCIRLNCSHLEVVAGRSSVKQHQRIMHRQCLVSSSVSVSPVSLQKHHLNIQLHTEGNPRGNKNEIGLREHDEESEQVTNNAILIQHFLTPKQFNSPHPE